MKRTKYRLKTRLAWPTDQILATALTGAMPVTTAGVATQAVEWPQAHAENLATSATVTGRFGVSASVARRIEHDVIYCKGTRKAVMTVGLTGGSAVKKEEEVGTSDKSAAGSEAECETFTTHEDGTYKCLLVYGDGRCSGGHTQRVRDGTWVLDTAASGRFTHDSTNLVECAE